jgi:uncharacterized protein YggE
MLARAIANLLMLSVALLSQAALAGERYEVKGQARVDAVPDGATILIPLIARSDDATEAMVQLGNIRAKIISRLKGRGVADRSITFDDDAPGVGPTLNAPGVPRYAVIQLMSVDVRDFSALTKLTQIVTESGNTDWSVSYDFGDRAKFVKLAADAALANARHEAELYAKDHGLAHARLLTTEKARTCFPHEEGLPTDCETVGEKPGPTEIVFTARRREGGSHRLLSTRSEVPHIDCDSRRDVRASVASLESLTLPPLRGGPLPLPRCGRGAFHVTRSGPPACGLPAPRAS